MKIGGFVKNSFLDYPGYISAVIFTNGCNMNCWYCHNQNLLVGHEEGYDLKDILKFIEGRKKFLDGVVISGGEPTLQPDLIDVMKQIKALGFRIKLDTNGTHYDILKKVIDEKLVDFVAMDIKAPFAQYEKITGRKNDMDSIRKCVQLLIGGVVDYEFRTTLAPNLSVEDIVLLAQDIKGAKSLALQHCRLDNDTDVVYMPLKPSAVESAREQASQYVDKVFLRGF